MAKELQEGQLDSVIVNGEEWIPLNGTKKDLERRLVMPQLVVKLPRNSELPAGGSGTLKRG